jgi:hypothetical protein
MLFKRGEHYVDYDNEYELLAKLRYYLAHPDECLKIARAGQQAYLKDHQPVQRAREVLSFAFGNGAASPVRDQRALAGSDGFGINLEERVRLYEICQKLSLPNERLRVVLDAALGARFIADLVDLPRLKVLVAFYAGPSPYLALSLKRLGVLDQVELIEGGPGRCDVLAMDVRTITGGRGIQDLSARLLMASAAGDVTESQSEWLAAQGFAGLGGKLWAIHKQ